MSEGELRDEKVITPDTIEELVEYIKALEERSHDYGTCVYAMSMSATAAFNYIARKLGVTGFQASCADMDILRRTRNLESGFRVLNFENLLYPQYCNDEHFPSWKELIAENIAELSKEAQKRLDKSDGDTIPTHPNVKAHWELLASGIIPKGE